MTERMQTSDPAEKVRQIESQRTQSAMKMQPAFAVFMQETVSPAIEAISESRGSNAWTITFFEFRQAAARIGFQIIDAEVILDNIGATKAMEFEKREREKGGSTRVLTPVQTQAAMGALFVHVEKKAAAGFTKDKIGTIQIARMLLGKAFVDVLHEPEVVKKEPLVRRKRRRSPWTSV